MSRIKISGRCISEPTLRMLAATLPLKLASLSLTRLSFTSLEVAHQFVELVVSRRVAALQVRACVFTKRMQLRLLSSLGRMGTSTLFLVGWQLPMVPPLPALAFKECTFSPRAMQDLARAAHTAELLSLADPPALDWSEMLYARHLVVNGLHNWPAFLHALRVHPSPPHTLNLEFNALGHGGLVDLFDAAHGVNMLVVGRGNGFGDAELALAFHQESVPHVVLDGAAITDVGVLVASRAFQNNPHIRSLSVLGCGLCEATMAHVAEMNRAGDSGKFRAFLIPRTGPWARVCDDMWGEMAAFL